MKLPHTLGMVLGAVLLVIAVEGVAREIDDIANEQVARGAVL